MLSPADRVHRVYRVRPSKWTDARWSGGVETMRCYLTIERISDGAMTITWAHNGWSDSDAWAHRHWEDWRKAGWRARQIFISEG
jgi:hypothetical protein